MEALERLLFNHVGEKTLLIVDTSPAEGSLQAFLRSAKFAVLDAKVMHTKRTSRHQSVSSLLEEARTILAFALSRGKTLVVRMGDIPVDFRSTFCDEACQDLVSAEPRPPHEEWRYLPRNFLLQSGKPVRASPFPESLLRRDDMKVISEGFAVLSHPNFKVIVTTTIPVHRVDDMLLNRRFGLPGEHDDYHVVCLE